MAQRINAAVVINPINLFAMAIVSSPRHALDERALAQQIDCLKAIASRLPYSPGTVLTSDESAGVIADALRLGFATRIADPLGDVIKVPDAQVSMLNYLRNNVLHAYALPALVASLLVGARDATPDRIAEFAEGGLPFLRAELMLHHSSEEAVAESRRIVALFVEIGLARTRADGSVRARSPQSGAHRAELIARSLRALAAPQLPGTIALLTRVGAGRLKRQRLEELMQMLSRSGCRCVRVLHRRIYERSTFAAYIDTLLETGLVREDADGSLHLHERRTRGRSLSSGCFRRTAVLAIQRVAVDHAPMAPDRTNQTVG
jgi:glycerol-3-phosphate O-acyltransferase